MDKIGLLASGNYPDVVPLVNPRSEILFLEVYSSEREDGDSSGHYESGDDGDQEDAERPGRAKDDAGPLRANDWETVRVEFGSPKRADGSGGGTRLHECAVKRW